MRKLLLILLIVIFLIGCKPIERIVERETVRTEYEVRHSRDSVYLLDSVYLEKKNDTVFKTKIRYLCRDVLKRDTIVKTDSVFKSVPVEVERAFSFWEKVKLKWFWFFAVGFGLLLMWTFRKWIVKLFV